MTRVFWTSLILILASAGAFAQSTWRGQAELWQGTNGVLAGGYVAASNDFTKNSIVTIENYKTKKSVQVRVVATLPPGSSAFILLSPKAATALEMGPGDTPLVGVQLDTSIGSTKGITEDSAENPDPDVNLLANRPKVAATTTMPTPVSKPTATSSAPPTPAPTADPLVKPAPTAPEPVVLATAPAATVARAAASTSPLELTRATTALDPDLVPLPALEAPPAVAPPLAEMTEESAPVTPGRRVFLSTTETEPVADEVPVAAVAEPIPEAPVAEAPVTPAVTPIEPVEPVAEAALPVAQSPATAEASPVATPNPVEEPKAVEAPKVVEAAKTVVATEPEAAPPAVAEAPVDAATTAATPAASAVQVVPQAPAAAKAWVATPGKLTGPILGTVGTLAQLEKGKPYVQVAAFSTQAQVLQALDTMTSYVPVTVYKAEGEKNPWRILVDSAPKAQMGVLMMQYRSQGYRAASIIKG